MKKNRTIALIILMAISPILFAQVSTDIESIPVMPGAKYSENYTQSVING